ncbi:protein-glutamate O-methyltransferase CheR [Sphingobacterium sp. lm-10]|uniref:CheR family methyltransferase n=1 Tax=Sphingobacterium sp. lm-10 TaxID=2944904 RepID=UPI002020E911|nr:protein-glutamate O-methyltransferase CheR [Sphingobacterium sp. lm-10]MCL7986965.1 protein-glutamate O-methyltransferase CheR [Sphingobacterium sp. lm-10]
MEPTILREQEFDLLFEEIAEKYGYDFTLYSKASLKRRVSRICMMDKLYSFAELRYQLMSNPEYLQRFVEEITVNVTEMYRDPQFYKTLRDQVLPQLATYPFIRIWVAGCATGEEVYSVAIMLQEANLYDRSLIYATDLNPTVLEKARNGVFSIRHMKQYSENYIISGGKKELSSYYMANYDVAKFHDKLKERVVFSTHNLVSDSSFNEFQLIMCRNVLIYFEKELQHKVFNLFDNSLEKLGYLALGSKESIRFSNLESTYKRVGSDKIWRKMN